jgi:hypothetical protein
MRDMVAERIPVRLGFVEFMIRGWIGGEEITRRKSWIMVRQHIGRAEVVLNGMAR